MGPRCVLSHGSLSDVVNNADGAIIRVQVIDQGEANQACRGTLSAGFWLEGIHLA